MLVVEKLSLRTWKVINLENDHEYTVIMRDRRFECHCQGWMTNHHCHHVAAVAQYQKETFI